MAFGGIQRHFMNSGPNFGTGGADLLTARFRVRIPVPEPIFEYKIGLRAITILPTWGPYRELTAFNWESAEPGLGLSLTIRRNASVGLVSASQ